MESVVQLKSALAGRYTIEREIGAGGMATVYLAHDIKHDRDVAIKVLHPDLGAALGGERFLTEIKTTAKLQHPHILPLLDSGEADSLLYYVMPVVTGETLRERLAREHQLPIEDGLRIAREVADALGHAHAHGIIHRDIKPENILLQGGHALVADFGIALAVQSAGGQRMTQTGLSLGTPQYMSPEQAMGEKSMDARTDVYALGAVTYEMLTGDPPFTGSTVQTIVAKVMTERPVPPRAVRDTVTPAAEYAILKALAKIPADRWPTAQAFAEALIAAGPPVSSTSEQVIVRRESAQRRLVTRAHGALTGAAIGAALWFALHAPASETRAPTRFLLSANTAEQFYAIASQPLAISADGRMIAYVGADRSVFVHSLDQIAPRQLPGTRGAAAPFFSPDGRWVAYFTNSGTILAKGKLVKTSVDGGSIVEIADGVQGFGGAWTRDGRILLGTQELTGGLASVAATGGALVAALDTSHSKGLHMQRWPRVLSDNETVLFTVWSAGPSTARMGVASLKTGRSAVLDVIGAAPLTVVDGFLIYMQASGTVMAVAFDKKNWKTTGEAIPVLEGASLDAQGAVRIAISESGNIAYAVGADDRRLVLVNEMGVGKPVVAKVGAYANPRFSRDARRVSVDISSPAPDVWVYDRGGGAFDRITTSGESDRAEWMPDDKRLFFRRTLAAGSALYSAPASGGGALDSVIAFADPVHEGTIAPDGRTLVFRTATLAGGRDLWSVLLGSAEKPKPVLTTQFQEMQPRLSRDGRWLAYASDESGAFEVYARSFPGDGTRARISTDGGVEPVWSPEGDRLYYRNNHKMMVAHVNHVPAFAVTRRDTLFEDTYITSPPHANYDVGPGGKEFVMIAPASGGSQVVMVLDWFSEVRARLAARGKGQ